MEPFIIKVLLSLVVGIVWVAASTYLAERVGGRLGGLIAGLPSTAVISLMFIGITQGVSAAMTASAIVPLSSGLYCFYFITYLLLSKRSFTAGFAGSLVVWFMCAAGASYYAPGGIAVSILLWLTLVGASVYWVVTRVAIDHERIPEKIASSPLWAKALITGCVIGLIVIVSKVAGPQWGGIFATFPALTVATLLITIKSGGIEFTRLIAKNILISTTSTIGLFATLCYVLYPVVGVVVGSLLAYGVLLAVSIPLYFLIFDKLKE
jgi:uncharacterized membrane protein (GlpM family)